MNGLEALAALKEGETIIYERTGYLSSFFVYRPERVSSPHESQKCIWTRFSNQWTWEKCENPPEFWMKTDGYRIYKEKKDFVYVLYRKEGKTLTPEKVFLDWGNASEYGMGMTVEEPDRWSGFDVIKMEVIG